MGKQLHSVATSVASFLSPDANACKKIVGRCPTLPEIACPISPDAYARAKEVSGQSNESGCARIGGQATALVPMDRHWCQWIANGFNGANCANGSPLDPLAPMDSLAPMNRHWRQWIHWHQWIKW